MHRLHALAAVTLAAVPAVARADLAGVIGVGRVRTFSTVFMADTGEPSVTAGDDVFVRSVEPWTESLAATAELPEAGRAVGSASQSVFLSAADIAGHGGASYDLQPTVDGAARAIGASAVIVDFLVVEPTEVLFTASVTGGSIVTGQVLLAGGGLWISADRAGRPEVTFGGVLAPGEYYISATTRLSSPTHRTAAASTASWDFNLRIIPAPSSLALLAAAGWLAARRRR